MLHIFQRKSLSPMGVMLKKLRSEFLKTFLIFTWFEFLSNWEDWAATAECCAGMSNILVRQGILMPVAVPPNLAKRSKLG